MNGLIALGVPGQLVQLLTTGLNLAAPPPPPLEQAQVFSLNMNVPLEIVVEGDEDESEAFAIPSEADTLSWQVIGDVADIDLMGSLDGGTHFHVVDNQIAAGIYTVTKGIPIVKIRLNTGTGPISVVLTAKRRD